MTWAAWLLGLALPLARKVLVGLGFGLVTYAGVSAGLDGIVAQVQASFGGLSGSVVQILALGGVFRAMSILVGALVAYVGWSMVSKLMLTAK